jgi:hypothetical protein
VLVGNEYKLATTGGNKPKISSLPLKFDMNYMQNITIDITYQSDKDCILYFLIEQNNSNNFFNRLVQNTLTASATKTTKTFILPLVTGDTGMQLRIDHSNTNAGYIQFSKIAVRPDASNLFVYRYIPSVRDVYLKDFPRTVNDQNTNDDAPRFNRMFNYIGTLTGKVRVILDGDTYPIKTKLTFNSQMIVVGNGSTFYPQTGFSGTTLIQIDDKQSSVYGKCIIDNVKFDGANVSNMIGCFANTMMSFYKCTFTNCLTGCYFNAICDAVDCLIWSNTTGIELHFTESIIDNLQGNSVTGILLSGEGNRIVNCKLYGNAMPNNKNTLCAVKITGSRNTISNNYFDQWKTCGVWLDDTKTDWLNDSGNVPTGAYGNIISNNLFFNNGHGLYDNAGSWDSTNNCNNISAGIVLRTTKSGGTLKKNNITGNVFETGYFLGWTEAGTTTTATQVGIHFIGYATGTILRNIISSNSFDNEIPQEFVYYNSVSTDNTVGLNN